MRAARSSALGCLGLVPALVVLGCGETTIDEKKAQTFIRKTVSDQAGISVETVACPADVKAQKGDTFTCVVTATDGTKGDVKVLQRDDKGNVNVSAPFLHMRDAEGSIEQEVKRQARITVAVKCPEIFVPRKGKTFKCTSSGGKRSRTIVVTTTNDSGNFTFRVR